MKVSVDKDLTITIDEIPEDEIGRIEHSTNRFDNYYDANGLNFMYVEEQTKNKWTVETNWSADCTLPTQETLKEQFEGWLAEENWKEEK